MQTIGLQKLNTTQISKQRKTQQNQTRLPWLSRLSRHNQRLYLLKCLKWAQKQLAQIYCVLLNVGLACYSNAYFVIFLCSPGWGTY